MTVTAKKMQKRFAPTKLRQAWDRRQKLQPITQRQFCIENGLDECRLSRILSGREKPRLSYALALRKKLGIPMDVTFHEVIYNRAFHVK